MLRASLNRIIAQPIIHSKEGFLEDRASVVVIGAGVIGCSTAYHLARAGLRDVVVLERGQVGSGSSSQSAAMLALQFCTDAITLQMARYSYERFMAFPEEMGVSVDFHRTGWMYVATEESAGALRDQVALLQRMGVASSLLDVKDVREIYPQLNTSDIVLGSWGPDDGPLDPHMVMSGYVKRARELGVRFEEDSPVTGLVMEEGRVRAVQTRHGTIECAYVINAAGPWATEIGRMAGIEVPIENSARTIVVTDTVEEIAPDRPFVEDLSAEWYFRPEMDGVLMGMGKKPVRDPIRVPLDEAQLEAMIEVAMHRVPALSRASLLTAWTGVRPLTSDGLPIVGEAAGVEGFLLNCGWGGVGIMLAPIAGKMLSEMVCEGKIEIIDAAPLHLSRFRRSGPQGDRQDA